MTFVKRWYRIPTPQEIWKKGPYDPWTVPTRQRYQETVECSRTVHAQLSPELLERYGIDPAGASSFRATRQRTWWDREQSERKRAHAADERERAAHAAKRW